MAASILAEAKMIGILLAAGAALGESLTDVFRKKTAMSFDPVVSAFVLHALTFVLALPFTLLVSFEVFHLPFSMRVFVHSFPASWDFWLSLSGSVALNAIAVYLVMDVLATAEIGMVLPLTTLSPVFLLLTAPIIVGEFPSPLGLVGILVTTVGTWGLARKPGQDGILKPFKLLWSQSNNRKMILVALLYAFSSPFDKRASVAGGPLWYLTCIDFGLAFVYLPFLFRRRRWSTLFSGAGTKLIPLGLANLFRAWCQFTALNFLIVPYVIGIKRFSIIFGILWGRWLFGERNTAQRLIASAVMILGSILILIASAK
jgi:drug/metabolite transporter (DMT)-like permease